VIEHAGLVDVEFGPAADTFAGAEGEEKARAFGTFGYPIRSARPGA
jgi:hypothetical protein